MFKKKNMPIPLHNITIPSIISIYLAVQYLDLTGKIKKVILQHFQFYFIVNLHYVAIQLCTQSDVQ